MFWRPSVWRLYFQCADCGHGLPVKSYNVYTNADSASLARTLCRNCGHDKFYEPRPGRTVSAAVWYKPWTWGTRKWEYRDQDAQPLPSEPNPKPAPKSSPNLKLVH